MENIKFLGGENEVQKIYSDLGLIVPVGDLSTGKAPGFKVYEVKYNEDGEDSAVNATIQIYCNSEGYGLYALYKTSDIEELFPDGVPMDYDLDDALNNPESHDPIQGKTQYAYNTIPFRKDMYTLSMPTHNDDYTSAVLPYDDYTLIMSVYSYGGGVTTVTSQFSAIAPPNWASADEVLLGNKFIADGVELVGEIETKDSTDLTVSERTVTVPAGYYAENASASVSSDYIIPTGSTSITTNGTGVDIAQYATVDVAVPNGTETLNATTNNTYYPTSPNIGFSEVVVNVPASAVVSGTLPITQNGTGIDVTNYAAVDVAVPSGGPSNYLELQLGDPNPWEDAWQNKYSFGGYLTLNLNSLTIPAGGTASGNTPPDWVSDMEYMQCYLDAQHNDFFMVDCTSYNGILNDPRQLGNAFITSNDTIIIPCNTGVYNFDPDTGDPIPNYDNIPCGQTDLTGDFEVYAVTDYDPMTGPTYDVVATGTYFIPATQTCVPEP